MALSGTLPDAPLPSMTVLIELAPFSLSTSSESPAARGTSGSARSPLLVLDL